MERTIIEEAGEEENEAILNLPFEDEIEKMVKDLPKGKSPRIYVMTSEVLHCFWPVMRPACIALVQTHWIDDKLISRALISDCD